MSKFAASCAAFIGDPAVGIIADSYGASAGTTTRRDSCQNRKMPEPTTITEPNRRLTVGTSPQTAKPIVSAHTSERYWNGATAEVGARCSARVHQYCPIALVMPLNSISPASHQLGIVKPNGSINEKNTVINES